MKTIRTHNPGLILNRYGENIHVIHHIHLRYYEQKIAKKNMFANLFGKNERVSARVVANYIFRGSIKLNEYL